jgi:pyridoxal biosynthesis lyase PdxS
VERETGTFRVKSGLAEMLKGGVIMDVTTADQAKIAEDAGACAVMALERVPADIRAEGGVARMADATKVEEIMNAVSVPVMAKARIGHFVEAQILQALGVDYVDESEVLTPADEEHHIDKWAFTVPFVCGARNLGEALRRIAEGAAMIRTKGEAGTGNVVEAVRHQRTMLREIGWLQSLRPEQLVAAAKDLGAPVDLVREAPGRELRRRGPRDAGGCRADDAARGRRRVRRLRDLQVGGPGPQGSRDRRGHDAFPGPRRAREGLARPRRADARARHQGARRGGSAPDPRVVSRP